MKLYIPSRSKIFRINIKKQRFKTEHINLCECTLEEINELIRCVVKSQDISPFIKGNMTTVEIREALGSINGISTSLSFKGLDPEELKDLILKSIK